MTTDDKDVAGPMIGWNFPNGEQANALASEKSLDELMTFPDRYTFKVVALTSESLLDDVKQTLVDAVGRADDIDLSRRPSAKGKYESITATLTVHNQDEVYGCYEKLKDIPGVKYVL